MIMRIIKSILMIAIMLGILAGGIYYIFFDEDDMKDAITEYEDGDFRDSMKILNTLARVENYESAEKVYYYRVKVMHALADQLTRDHEDELKNITSSNKNEKEVRENIRDINEEIEKINSRFEGDLTLKIGAERSYVVSQGKLYEEFTSLYNGSRYIEDLDFDMTRKNVKLTPQSTVQVITGFFKKYPDTGYLASAVSLLFDNISRTDLEFREHATTLEKMLTRFCVRYPTSSEYHRIYTCNGNNVNLRDTPGLEGGIVGKLAQDELCIQLERSMDSMQIGDVRDYWYRIVSIQGKRGWIFGKFLDHVDTDKYQGEKDHVNWVIDETFTSWDDSHTPSGWQHIKPGNRSVLSFEKQTDGGIARIESDGRGEAGLYRRVAAFRSFQVQARARFTGGDGVTLFALVVPGNGVYRLTLEKDGIDVSGRKVPFNVTHWHQYELKSGNGVNATLLVDGEILSAKIQPVQDDLFQRQALYILHCREGIPGMAELQYIRIR